MREEIDEEYAKYLRLEQLERFRQQALANKRRYEKKFPARV